MVFNYRDYEAFTIATFSGAIVLSCSLVSWVIWRYQRYRLLNIGKAPEGPKILGRVACLLYVACMCLVAVLTMMHALFNSAVPYLLLGTIQSAVVLIGLANRVPCLSHYLVVGSNWCVAIFVFFLLHLPSLLDYTLLVGLVACFAGLPLGIMAGLLFITNCSSDPQVSLRHKFRRSIRRYCLYLSFFGGWALGFLLTYFLAGTCTVPYGNDLGGFWIQFSQSSRWSSRFMRSFMDSPCSGKGPCHVYLTTGPDLTSEVFVNVHLPITMNVAFLTVDVNGGAFRVNATEFATPLLDPHDQRLIFSAFIPRLAPGSDHFFKLSTNDGPVGEQMYEFRTAPLTEASFVTAGDAGISKLTETVIEQMVKVRPHFAVIGGDVAYDNGYLSCACAWDAFLRMWESKRVDGRFLVPFSLAIGNHDIGADDNNEAFIPKMRECNPEDITRAKPIIFAWFPFEAALAPFGADVLEPLPVCRRGSLHKHHIADLVNVWILDTAYAVSLQDNINFVDNHMSAGRNIAVYHVPLYDSNVADYPSGLYLQDAWVDGIFDKHAFAACFENHGHTYKRTRRLYANRISTETRGTVYFGDGRMGVQGGGVPDSDGIISPEDSELFETTGIPHHFFHVQVSNPDGIIIVRAIDESGNVFDSDSLP